MSHQEILEKSIEKAKAGGYAGVEMPFAIADRPSDKFMAEVLSRDMARQFASIVIFRHDFAKAFWGEAGPCNCGPVHKDSNHRMEPGWKPHLQQMVLEEDPIRYLEKFL